MQIRPLILLLSLAVLPLAGNTSVLLPEWQKNFSSSGKVVLPQWRISDWGHGSKNKKNKRSASITAPGGKLQVTLENPAELRSANLLFRSLTLKDPGRKLYRLKAVMVNNAPQKALVRLRMISSGAAQSALSQRHFTVSETAAERELELTVPAGSKNLQITLTLLGPGKVTFSSLRLTAEEPPQPSSKPELSGSLFSLPEKTPAEMTVKLPPAFKLNRENTLTLTLPWGVRLISHSPSVAIKNVSLKVKEKSVTVLTGLYSASFPSQISLLLGSDLPVSEDQLQASLFLTEKDQPGEPVYFRLRTVKESEAVPPRHFKIALSAADRMVSHESIGAVDSAWLRSGANILFMPRITIPPRQLRTAKISQRVYLHLSPARPQKHCHYAEIRNETYWEKYFIPALKKQILRFGARHIDAIVCDSFLGQKRGVFCCCTICRTEFADFAPKLPQRDIMNLSQGILNARYAKDLKKFRQARLTALWAGARLHLPLDSRGFSRKPALIPIFPLSQVLNTPPPVVKSPETIIDLQPAPVLPDGIKYDPSVNFFTASAVCKKFRKSTSQRTAVIARYTVPVKHITPEELKFEVYNLLFCGFSGVWVNLPAGADHSYRAAIARSAAFIRENESFFRRGALEKHSWILKSDAKAVEIPPVASASGYLLDLPRSHAPLKLLVWKWGTVTLAAVGNFSSEAQSAALLCPAAPLQWQEQINGGLLKGKDLRTRGLRVTVPPRSWLFLKFKGI